jgi:hypothetical protein
MTSENDLLQKLMVSKAIMQKHETIKRGDTRNVNMSAPELKEFQTPQANYNIPQEFMSENTLKPKPAGQTTPDRIMSSKLPDEIKQLMIEHPISQPNSFSGPTLSDDLIEKASRLMGTQSKQMNESTMNIDPSTSKSNVSVGDLKDVISSIVRETVEDVLKENGLLVESTKRSDDVFKFRVGQHLFEGKVTKIRKVSK